MSFVPKLLSSLRRDSTNNKTSVSTHTIDSAANDNLVGQIPVIRSAKAEGIRVDCIQASEINDALRKSWHCLRQQSEAYRSPFFGYRFVEEVARLAPNIEIAVATRGSETVGLFAYQRYKCHSARPVGVGINDAHGPIFAPDAAIGTVDLMRECKLNSFPFHASPRDLPDFDRFELGTTRAFLADLTVDPLGYEHYLRSTSNTIDRQGQKTRKLSRQQGPLRFEFDCRDPRLLDHLIALKSEQYRRTHTYDILGTPWIQQLLHRLHDDRDHCMRGILNVLWAGDVPVALHYGIVEGKLLHYWFPVFEAKYSYGSPGTQLFLDVAKAAQEQGFTAIDMGYGEQAYKYKLTNVISHMGYGLIDENPIRQMIYRQKLALRKRLKELSFKSMIKPLFRKIMPDFGKGSYEA